MVNATNKELVNQAVDLRERGALEDALKAFQTLKEKFEAEKAYKDLVTVLGGLKITYQHLAERIDINDSDHDKKVIDFISKASSAMNKAMFFTMIHPNEVPQGNREIMLIHNASIKVALSKYIKDNTEKKIKLLSALQDTNDAILKLAGSEAHKAWPMSLKARILFLLGETEDAIEAVEQGYIFIKEGYSDELKANQGARNLAIWETGLKIIEARILNKLNRTDEAIALLKGVLIMSDPESAPNALELRREEATKLIEEFATKTSSEK